jgi:DNA-binding MarR family transcriptional regulator
LVAVGGQGMPQDGNLAETVELLDNLSGQEGPNQRALARKIGISVGLVNALVHRAVRKGLVKIQQAPARRYAYYLTPKGFAEKSRLVAEYLDYSLSFFRTARQEYNDTFGCCATAGCKRVVLCGAGELAEIATLAADGTELEIVGIVDRTTNQVRVAGLPVLREFSDVGPQDALVITDGRDPQAVYETLRAQFGAERIFAPAFLRISQKLKNSHGAR